MEALLNLQDKAEKSKRMIPSKREIVISLDYKDLIDDRFLIYVALLQLQGEKVKFGGISYGHIYYKIVHRYHFISPGDKEIKYSTYILLLIIMTKSDEYTLGAIFPEDPEFGKYEIDKQITENLLKLLEDLEFPLCTIHGAIRSIESPRFYIDESEEVKKREPMFTKKDISDELFDRVMDYIGFGRSVKSARNT